MKCPIDNTDLVMSDRQGIEIDYCPQCRGVWLDRGEIDKIVERSQGVAGPAPALQHFQQPPQQYAQPQQHQQHGGYRQDNHHYDDDNDHHHNNHHNNRHHKKESWLGDLFD